MSFAWKIISTMAPRWSLHLQQTLWSMGYIWCLWRESVNWHDGRLLKANDAENVKMYSNRFYISHWRCILAWWIYHIYHTMLSSKQISFLERICQLVKYIWCKANDTWTVRCIETHWIYKREFFPMWLLFLQWTDNWYPFETLQWSWCWENQAVNSMLQMTYITIIYNKCNVYLLWNRK